MKNIELDKYLSDFLKDNYQPFLKEKPEPTAIRVNTLKTSVVKFKKKLTAWGISFKPLPYESDGFIIEDDFLPLSHSLDFFRGYFQYQGIASQVPAIVLNPQPGDTALDMAAAPGSKSTQMAALMKNEGQLYLNDINRNRLQALNANMQKAGVFNQIMINLPGERLGNLFPAFFDKVLLDAPCTATGTYHSNPDIEHWWSNNKLDKLASLQERLFISAFKCLKTGGEMVYSTCSLAPEENEMLIQKMIDAYPLQIKEISQLEKTSFLPGLSSYKKNSFHEEMQKSLRLYPHIHRTEGFFIIKLKKTADHKTGQSAGQLLQKETKIYTDKAVREDLEHISDKWGVPSGIWKNYRYIRTKSRIWMVNSNINEVPASGFMSAGLLLAEKKINGWKLFNQSVQYLGAAVSRRKISLVEEKLKLLFNEGSISLNNIENGYHVLEWKGEQLGSIYAEKERIHIRLPHKFRLVI